MNGKSMLLGLKMFCKNIFKITNIRFYMTHNIIMASGYYAICCHLKNLEFENSNVWWSAKWEILKQCSDPEARFHTVLAPFNFVYYWAQKLICGCNGPHFWSFLFWSNFRRYMTKSCDAGKTVRFSWEMASPGVTRGDDRISRGKCHWRVTCGRDENWPLATAKGALVMAHSFLLSVNPRTTSTDVWAGCQFPNRGSDLCCSQPESYCFLQSCPRIIIGSLSVTLISGLTSAPARGGTSDSDWNLWMTNHAGTASWFFVSWAGLKAPQKKKLNNLSLRQYLNLHILHITERYILRINTILKIHSSS